ncbi:hypothetical protein [Pseudomonas sp. RIT288]|uniref:hypothetical protein n=1 Tax=Pseudomonas sp. RIT288 TaxID=1470589 RepID=UPI0004536368|nr:hypothetical protein [Pseudomonas sp. RIT288]EZP33724.1 hypothetical protein BW33_00912 [Pseudomonas sp. RIT288]
MSKEIEARLEGIHHELSGSESDMSYNRQKSLKYHVRGINQGLNEWLRAQSRQQEQRSQNLKIALGLLGFIGLMLAITRAAGSDIEWVREHTLAFRLWGVALCTMFVGVSLERSAFVKSLWDFTVTKLIVSIALSCVVIYARGKAAGYINAVFHADASALPITLVYMTGLMVFKLLLPFVFAVTTTLFVVHVFAAIGWLKDKITGKQDELPPLYSLLSIFVSGVILFYGWNWSNGQLSDSRVPEKVYLMAHALDFNQSHDCANIDANKPVVFLGNAQESVLVAPYKLENIDFVTVFDGAVIAPGDFTRKKCDYRNGSNTRSTE